MCKRGARPESPAERAAEAAWTKKAIACARCRWGREQPASFSGWECVKPGGNGLGVFSDCMPLIGIPAHFEARREQAHA